ncbi:MAG: hypothetical protein QOK31_1953 [Solirubrobacteraceae bacterium]|nr:hypothetical protein [Solirubrobacteraceae bacterium]
MSGSGVRLRQAVVVAADLEPVAERLREELGLGEPFADPGVAEFGIRNAVFALGDAFLEVISPARPGTAAGRHLERHGGDCGYMLIFQLDDLATARERVAAGGIRVVWQIDLPDISGTHLHPADVGGAIVSLDRADPPESWRWGGPAWTGRAGEGAPGRLSGAALRVHDPAGVSKKWGEVLGVSPSGGDEPELGLDHGGRVGFAAATTHPEEGLDEIEVALPQEVRRDRAEIEIGGVRFRFAP